MKFEIYIPTDVLKPFINAFAIQETDAERTYKVFPDTGLVIGFQYKGRLSYFNGEQQMPLSPSGITGLRDSYRIFKNSTDTGSVLVFFKEAGAAAFFKHPLHELFGESVSLDNFTLRSELLLLEEKLCEAKSDKARIDIVEAFLITRMLAAKPDPLVLAAISLIHKSKGSIRIKELAEQLHISQSPLEKRFRKAVGASPKKFASVVRFRNTLEHFNSQKTLTHLGYEAGFYDQAHFIKEFKTFTGETPEVFFSSNR